MPVLGENPDIEMNICSTEQLQIQTVALCYTPIVYNQNFLPVLAQNSGLFSSLSMFSQQSQAWYTVRVEHQKAEGLKSVDVDVPYLVVAQWLRR